jgi:hypothetical protein
MAVPMEIVGKYVTSAHKTSTTQYLLTYKLFTKHHQRQNESTSFAPSFNAYRSVILLVVSTEIQSRHWFQDNFLLITVRDIPL